MFAVNFDLIKSLLGWLLIYDGNCVDKTASLNNVPMKTCACVCNRNRTNVSLCGFFLSTFQFNLHTLDGVDFYYQFHHLYGAEQEAVSLRLGLQNID